MRFFLKLFKALNSAQTPWQVTLAIVLGMIIGLTPLSGIQTVLLVFLPFLLNIHLGLFFMASAFFAGIGYLFDPWFEHIGFALLISEGLSGVWTALYNNGLTRLSYFNNTLVLGSTIVSLVLALPLYLLLGWLISKYRDALSSVLKKYPKLGLFGILKASDIKVSLLRWWGAGVFVGFAVVVSGFVMLIADPMVKMALEKGASMVLQRDVRVGSVDIDFSEGAVVIDRMEIASEREGVDALSIERIGFDIALNSLLFNKTHVETIQFKGMGFGTKATLAKAAAQYQAQTDESTVPEREESKSKMPSFELPDPKELIEKADLKSLKVYDETQNEIAKIRKKWEEVADKEFSSEALKEYQKDYEAIKSVSDSKDPTQLLRLKEKISGFKKKIDERKAHVGRLKKEFAADKKHIQVLIKKAQDAPMEDYNALKSTYTLDGKGGMNVVSLLFVEKIKTYVATAEKYFAMAEPYLKSDKTPEKTLPPRGTGRWIKFAETVPSPDLLIGKTEIDGIVNDQSFAAVCNDITDNQKELGRAMTFHASSDGPSISGLVIRGEDNRLSGTVMDRVDFKAKQIKLDKLAVSTMTLSNALLGLTGEVVMENGSNLNAHSSLAFSNTSITMNNLEGKTSDLVAKTLEGIDAFHTDVRVTGRLQEPKVSVSTDLDSVLSKAVMDGLSEQAKTYQNELKGLLSAQGKDRVGMIAGEAGQMVDINTLAGNQTKALGEMGSGAGGLLKGRSKKGIKSLLSF